METLRRRAWFIVAALLVALVLGAGGWFLYCAAEGSTALRHAYMSLRAAGCATHAIEQFVRQRQRWPASWQELESNGTDWLPDGGWDEVRTYVDVDFNATLDEVASQSDEDFRAIRPVPPSLTHRLDFAALRKTAQDVLPAQDRSATPGGEALGNAHHAPPAAGAR